MRSNGLKQNKSGDTTIESKLQQLFLDKNNFTLIQRKYKLDSLYPYIDKANYHNHNLYLYLRGALLENSGKSDSALKLFDKMLQDVKIDSIRDADLVILKSIGQISAKSNSWIDGKLINSLQAIIKYAEKESYEYIYEVYNVAAGTYFKFGDTVNPVYYLQLGYDHYPGPKTPAFKAYYYNRMGTCLIAGKRWKEANVYLDSGYQIALFRKDTVILASTYEKKRSIYAQAGDFQKETYYQNQAFFLKQKANLLTETDWSNQALNLQNQGKYYEAIKYYLESLNLAKRSNKLYGIQNAYAGLHANYRLLGEFEIANRYLDSSYDAEVSILEKREADKVADITLRYEQEKKDERIIELNKQTLLQGRILRLQKIIIFSLTACIVAVCVIGIILFRQRKLRLENERLEAAWNKLSLEQRLLRSQMEPHFVFNTLSVLQGFIRSKQNGKAIKYLSGFARLLRLNLENSRKDFVFLSEEIEALENYLMLQQMRNESVFSYTIRVYEGYQGDNVLIPPMLIQPFVENAVMHGVRNVPYPGEIIITINKIFSAIHCTIQDNGIGIDHRKHESKNSLSTVITQERLDGLSRQTNQVASLMIDSNRDHKQGVEVNLIIPFNTQ